MNIDNYNYEVKKAFVTHELSRCMAAVCHNIVKLEYHLHDTDCGANKETVIIRMSGGYLMRVDVTGDDLMDTLQDVLHVITNQDNAEAV